MNRSLKPTEIIVSSFIIIICFSLFIFKFINKVSSNEYNNSEKEVVADGFTIENYNVDLKVNEKNVVDVTETIMVNFTSSSKRGILKFVPEWLEYTGKDGKTIKRKSIITDLRAVNEDYLLDRKKRKQRIRIGNEYQFVDLGLKEYTIKYTYNMGRDPFKGYDEFIFHTFGDYWGTDIKNASIKLTMPKRIDGYNINFFLDKYRKNNINNAISYNIDNNTLYAKFMPNNNNGQNLKKSLTLDIELPENYFNGGSWNYGYIAFILIILIIIIMIYIIYMWSKFGKDYPKKVPTVEFYPPDNMSAAEIGYIYNNGNIKQLTISLIIELASKGYIKIDEVGDKKKNIQITNLVPIPNNPLPDKSSILPKREIIIKKLKDIDDSLDEESKKMMNYLFRNSNEMTLIANIESFLKVRDNLINSGYIEIIKDNEQEIIEKEQEYEKMVKNNETEGKDFQEELTKLPKMTEFEEIIYYKLFSSGNIVKLNEHLTFYKAFEEIYTKLNTKTKDLVQDSVATKKMHLSIILIIIICILFYASYMIEDLDPKIYFMYKLPLIAIIASIIFTIFMKRKTSYGEEIIAKVKGFRNFLIKAEKENLESLVEKDPKYFYNILPYTYVLGISKKWVKKFENIPMPDVDMGNFNYDSEGSFYSIYDDVYFPVSTYSSSSGGGCSSCGGGCSSCGGGCSSCGGGGSW